MTIDREQVLRALRAEQTHIEQLYGLRMVGIVGSVARGEAREDSDIDVIVDIIEAPSLFGVVEAEEYLEEAIGLGLSVEFVFREGMRASGRRLIERDLVPL
jgi:uncharacterized protein